MQKRRLLLAAAALIIVTLACGLPAAPTVTPEERAGTGEPTPTSQATPDQPTPSDTPAPTETATPTEPATEAPTPTPEPTSVLSCTIDIAPELAPRLNAHPAKLRALGCPIDPAQQTWAAEQRFQLGRMFWQEDTGEIHLVYDDETYQIEPNQYQESSAQYPCPEEGPPPPSLEMPKRGFGWHWCNTPNVQEKIGWALEEEIGYEAAWQTFENGHALSSHLNHVFIFYNDGTWDYIE